MAVPWLAVLKTVPWSDVISNAPLVAEGAKRLWKAVSKKEPEVAAPPAPEQDSAAVLEGRLAAAEATIAELHGQMLATSELIKTLADQNAQLVARVEADRVRLLWLTGIAVAAAVLSLASLFLGRV